MGLTRRGRRNPKSARDKTKEWLANGGLEKAKLVISKTSETRLVEEYPDHFLGIQSSAKNVSKKMKKHFPGVVARNLPSAPSTGRLLYPTPETNNTLHPDHPPYLAMRFDNVINNKANKILVASWDHLISLNVRFPKADRNRSSSPALHLGIWEVFQKKPYTSADSRQQEDEVIQAMNKFLYLIGEHIAPKLHNLLQEFCPIQYELQARAYRRVCESLPEELKNRPALDFQGVFFTVAVKEGSSEKIHLDFNDNPNSITWVVPLTDSDWEGGDFCAPQLGEKIPVRRGQVLGAMTRVLAHCGTPITHGRRVILTLFSDHFIMGHSR